MDSLHIILILLNVGVLGAIMVLSGVIKGILEVKVKR